MHFQSLSKKVLVNIGAIHLYTSAQLMPDVTVFYIEFGILNEIWDITFTFRGMLLFGGGGDVVYHFIQSINRGFTVLSLNSHEFNKKHFFFLLATLPKTTREQARRKIR